jgi:hypothetical protein
MRTAAGHGKYDDNAPIRSHFKFNAPITNPAAKYSICSLEKFDVAVKWVDAHILEGLVNVLKVGARHITKVPYRGLSDL